MASVLHRNGSWMLRMPGVRPMKNPANSSRLALWIDSVGGYLVCLSNELTLGQPVPGDSVDIPILGDVSRRHAMIERDAEGYVLRPLRVTLLDGPPRLILMMSAPLSAAQMMPWAMSE